MNKRIFVLMLIMAGGAGCAANRTQRVPTLTAPPQSTAAPAAPQRDLVKEVGDTTWSVVTAPARLVIPKKEPTKEPEVYEAPTAIFTRRNYGEEDGTAGASTGPATHP